MDDSSNRLTLESSRLDRVDLAIWDCTPAYILKAVLMKTGHGLLQFSLIHALHPIALKQREIELRVLSANKRFLTAHLLIRVDV